MSATTATPIRKTPGTTVLANERMAAALKAKAYKYQHVYSQDSRHVDRAVVAQTLPEALEWLWKAISAGVRP